MERRLFYLLLLLSLLIRIFGGLVNPWGGDAITHIITAIELGEDKFTLYDMLAGSKMDCLWCYATDIYWYPPLFHIALSLVSFSHTLLKLFNPVLFSITAILFYRLMRLCMGESSSQLATLLFAYQPYSIVISAVPYAETLLLLFAIVSLYFLRMYELRKKDPFLILSGVSITLAILSKYSALPLFFVLGLYLVLQKKFRAALILSFSTLFSILPWLVRNQIQLHTPLFIARDRYTLGAYLSWFVEGRSDAPILHIGRTYFEFWGVPEGNFNVVLGISPVLFAIYALLTISLSSFMLKAIIEGIKKERASLMTLLFTFFLLFKIFLLRTGSGTYFRYVFLMIIPLAYFTGMALSKMTKRHKAIFLTIYILLAFLTIPKFVIAREQFNELDRVMIPYIEAQGRPLVVEPLHLKLSVDFYFESVMVKDIENATSGDLLLIYGPHSQGLPFDSFTKVKETDNYALFEIQEQLETKTKI